MCHAFPEDYKEDNFEATFDEPYDESDTFLRIEAGEAPDKVFHTLNDDARLQALSFQRPKTIKFVRDMIEAGLFPIVSNLKNFRGASASVDEQKEKHKSIREVKELASKIPAPSTKMLEAQ